MYIHIYVAFVICPLPSEICPGSEVGQLVGSSQPAGQLFGTGLMGYLA